MTNAEFQAWLIQQEAEHNRHVAERERAKAKFEQEQRELSLQCQAAALNANCEMIQGVAEHLRINQKLFGREAQAEAFKAQARMLSHLADEMSLRDSKRVVDQIITKAQRYRPSLWQRLLTAVNRWLTK